MKSSSSKKIISGKFELYVEGERLNADLRPAGAINRFSSTRVLAETSNALMMV